MRIVHIAGKSTTLLTKPTKRQQELAATKRRLAIHEQTLHRKALLKYTDRIKAIQMKDPTWIPIG